MSEENRICEGLICFKRVLQNFIEDILMNLNLKFNIVWRRLKVILSKVLD